MNYKDRLKFFAKTAYGSASNLATAAGIHPSQMSRYMTGDKKPHWDALERLNTAGLSIDWLVSGTGSMYAGPGRMERLEECLRCVQACVSALTTVDGGEYGAT